MMMDVKQVKRVGGAESMRRIIQPAQPVKEIKYKKLESQRDNKEGKSIQK